MGLLRFTAFLLAGAFPAFAQNSPSKGAASPAAPTASLARQMTQLAKASQADQASPAAPQFKHSRPSIIEIDSGPVPTFLVYSDPYSDPGIYVKTAPGSVCGTIVSYNFSAGPNPRLKNVTTCTSLNATTTRYAEGEKQKPHGPQLLYTK